MSISTLARGRGNETQSREIICLRQSCRWYQEECPGALHSQAVLYAQAISFFPQLSSSEHFLPLSPCLLTFGILTPSTSSSPTPPQPLFLTSWESFLRPTCNRPFRRIETHAITSQWVELCDSLHLDICFRFSPKSLHANMQQDEPMLRKLCPK